MALARHLKTLEHPRRAKASGSVRTRIGVPGLSRLSFRRGYCYPSDPRGSAGGRRVLLRRRPQCPDARLSACRVGRGLVPLRISGRRRSLTGWSGKGLPTCSLTNEEVSFHQRKAMGDLDSGAGG
ncbi:hypothetical protein GHT09_005639 [Marmota monax]|uniref:Uncharacterized protein n=1 Tax=Marmota monax TaxID=9995 RepID=A0A834QUE6_MARMO|nr:hypothetical protein GHT09_005639 [Marmota monax]